MTPQELIDAFDTLAEAPEGIERLRELVLQLAVRGQLVDQTPDDEPATALLWRAADEKKRAVSEGEAPVPRRIAELPSAPTPMFDVPAGWAWALLDDLAVYIQRGKSPNYDDSSPVKVVSQKCVQWAGFDISRARGLKPKSLDKYGPERFLRAGDLLWNSTGTGTVGRINVFPGCSEDTAIVADSHVTVIRPALVDPRFLFCWLAGPVVQCKIEELTTGTTKQQELGTGTVRGQSIPVPPLAEQHRIVAKVDELMDLIDCLEAARNTREATRTALRDAALAALQDADTPDEVEVSWNRIAERMDDLFTDPADVEPLRQTILQLAVRGRLVPQDPDDESASILLDHVAKEKGQLIKKKIIRKPKPLSAVREEELPFNVPQGWVWCRLGSVSTQIHYGYTASADHERSGCRLLRITDIQNNQVDWASVPGCEISDDDASKYSLADGDIVIARTGGTVGKSYRVEGLGDLHSVFASYLIRVAPSEDIDSRYVKRALETPLYWQQLIDRTSGTGQPNVNASSLSTLLVPVPPLNEQHRIVSKVDELMNLLDRLEKHLVNKTAAHDSFVAAAVHQLEA